MPGRGRQGSSFTGKPPVMRLILFLVLVYIFIRLINRFFFQKKPSAHRMQGPFARRDMPASVREMVQDPVCKVYIPKKDALNAVRNGTTYYFCSRDCFERFNGST
jgi:YHS domain-containing protein